MTRISVMDRLTPHRAAATMRAMASDLRRYAGRALRAGAATWALALPLAAVIAATSAGGLVTRGFSGLLFAIGSLVCHQRPERSFALWGAQLPVCARCTGLYVGAACAGLLYSARAARRMVSPLALLLAAGLPTFMTLVLEWLTPIAPSNAVRAAAGVPLGGAVLVVLLDELRSEAVR